MDWVDLEVFIKVAELKSMNKAAKEIPLSQSTVSTRIVNLEAEIGCQLFTRNRRGVRLTLDGQRFYYFAFYAFRAIELAKSSITPSPFQQPNNKLLRIGINKSLLKLILPGISRTIQSVSPTTQWKIVTGESAEMSFLTHAGELDITFISELEGDTISEEYSQIPLFKEQIKLIGPTEGYSYVYQDLQSYLLKYRFILMKRGTPIREMLENRVFKPLGVYPKEVVEVDTSEAVKELVKQGLGLSFVPMSSLWLETVSNYKVIEARNFSLEQQFVCLFSKSIIPPYKKIVDNLLLEINSNVTRIKELSISKILF